MSRPDAALALGLANEIEIESRERRKGFLGIVADFPTKIEKCERSPADYSRQDSDQFPALIPAIV